MLPEHRAGSHGTHEPRGWLCSAVPAWPRSHKHTRWSSSRSTTCRKTYVRMCWVVQRSLGGRLTLRLRSAIPGMCDCIRQIRQNQRCRAGTHAAAEAAVRGCVAVCVACAWLAVWLCKMPNSHIRVHQRGQVHGNDDGSAVEQHPTHGSSKTTFHVLLPRLLPAVLCFLHIKHLHRTHDELAAQGTLPALR